MRDERDTDPEECLCSPRTLNVNNHETASLGNAGIISTEQQEKLVLPIAIDHDVESAKKHAMPAVFETTTFGELPCGPKTNALPLRQGTCQL
jgi:hypothetical protein